MSLQHTSPASTTSTTPTSTASLLGLAALTESRALSLHPTSPALALTTLIAATEHYIAARRTSRAPQLIDKKIHDLLTRAERWKAVQTTRLAAENALANPETPGRPRRTPIRTGGDTVKEQTVLLKSSRVDGGVFPPWTGPPRKEEFSGGPWTDPAGMLRLAEGQDEMLAEWRRAREVFGGADGEGMGEGKMEGRWDLTQDLVTDCSVIASLCAALRREEAGWGDTVAGNVWPQDEKGRPVESENGKYVVRLWFNGCWRKVVIDDFLPASKNERTLYVTCRNNPHVFLYALIEKAYLKVLGGYDFPGSNSGTDLLALTGWIPEHVFLQDDDMNADSLWRRMTTAWASGDLLITLGTGPMTRFEERTTGLVGEHDYAVLELKMEAGERRLLVKNPWSQATVWRGLASDSSEGDFDRSPSPSPPSTFSTSALAKSLPAAIEEPGTFWISLENTIRNFTSLYLNFSLSLFTHIHQTHLTYDLATKLSETCFLRNPQYTLTAPTATPVWVLLTRHTTTPTPGFIALYAFATSTRTILSSRPLARTPFLDSPQTLLRLDLSPNAPHTIVLATQHLPPTTTAFSLHFHSAAPLTITPPQDPHPYTLRLPAAWTRTTAGGPAHAEYAANPQFRINLPRTSSLTLLLESASSHPLHIALYHSRGERVSSPTTRDIIAASGEYIKGAALCRVDNLAPGAYTAVASTFERGQEGTFELAVMAGDGGVRCEPLRAETAGCFCTVRGGEWGLGVREVVVELEVERLGAVWVRCRGGEARVVLRDGGRVVLAEGRGRTEKGDLRSGVGGYRVCVRREGGEREWEIEVVSEVAVWVGEDEEV